MRGRKPKPAAQQIAEGDPRKLGVHRLEQKLKAEVKGDRGLPRCPTHLKGLARKAWRFWSEELMHMNLDCRPDAMMLEGACIAYQAAIEAYEMVQKQGPLVAKTHSRSGDQQARGEQHQDRIRRWLKGMRHGCC